MADELKITAERVRAAAAGCADAKRVLTVLFPEAFVADRPVKTVPKTGAFEGAFLFPNGHPLRTVIQIRDTPLSFTQDEQGLWLSTAEGYGYSLEDAPGGHKFLRVTRK